MSGFVLVTWFESWRGKVPDRSLVFYQSYGDAEQARGALAALETPHKLRIGALELRIMYTIPNGGLLTA